MIFHASSKVKEKVDFVKMFDSIKQVPLDSWNTLAKNNIYLSFQYLSALEEILSQIGFKYLVFYGEDRMPLGIAITQIVELKNNGKKYNDLICRVGKKVKDKLIESLQFKLLICGNVFNCGENAWAFSNKTTPEKFYNTLVKSLLDISKAKNISSSGACAIVLKEFSPEFPHSKIFTNNKYASFEIDVNMVLKIHSSWNSFDAYLNSMITKFRTKAKSVYKKSEKITSLNFTEQDILAYANQIDILYNQVLNNAEFYIEKLNAKVFFQFKKNLPSNFLFTGYFINNNLVAFSTCFLFNNILDTNYIGFDYSLNKEYGLYQRILYDYVAVAINNNCKEVKFGRTSEEIKSCLGAEPVPMKFFARHRNTISNKLLKPFIKQIKPSEFEFRRPFKTSFNQPS